jgi:hypothetical protein
MEIEETLRGVFEQYLRRSLCSRLIPFLALNL